MSENSEAPQPETQRPEPQILTEIQYKPGQENKATHLSLLDDLPIKHAISWGKDAGNMSVKYSKGQEPEEVVRERINKFLGDNAMEYYQVGEDGEKHPHVIHMIGAFEGTHLQTHEVLGDELEESKDETLIQANFVFTTNPDIVMVIRPGDCPVSIVHAKVKDKYGKDRDLLAFIHSSAQSANAGLPRHAIRYLIDVLHVDPKTIKIGIAPGVSMENYTITQDDIFVDNPKKPGEKIPVFRPTIMERNWKGHISRDQTGDPSEKRKVDIMGATIMQFTEEGIDPSNIQAIDVDSYAAAERKEAFSHSLSVSKGVPEGRYMIAAQLKKPTETSGRNDKSILPEDTELTRILEKEAKRAVPVENLELHFPQYETAMRIFEHYGIPTDIFVDPSLDIQQVVVRGKQLLDQLVQKIEFNTLSEDEIALFDSAYEYLSEEDNLQASDFIFVFGAKTPLRAEKAAELYKKGLGENVVVSGGSPFYQPDEEVGADRYRRILVENGVPQGQIISENRSITMPDNVRSSLNLLDNYGINPRSMILVNSPYAQRRGWSIMKKYLPGSVSLYRVNSDVDQELSKDQWYKQEKSLRVVLNEFIKMRAGVVSNTA